MFGRPNDILLIEDICIRYSLEELCILYSIRINVL